MSTVIVARIVAGLSLAHIVMWAFTGLSLVAPLAAPPDSPVPYFFEAIRAIVVAILHVVPLAAWACVDLDK